MSQMVAAELLKLRTTRAWIGFLLAGLALAGIAAAGTVGTAEDFRLGTTELSREILSASGIAEVIAFVVGIVSVTAEWRHGTVTRTFLATPRRDRVLVAKELGIVVPAALLWVLTTVLALAIAVPWLAFEGSSFALGEELAGYAGRILVTTVLWGALGVGVGAIVQSQTPAVVGAILWVLVAEGLITAALGLADLEVIGDYFPGRALSAFDASGDEGGLSTWPAGAVGLGWVAVLGLLGHLRMSRQDVT
ncbi:MAG TPA: hypothetical protein VI540_01975 [Gaiellaceae bacterium]|nr:hypothetical protein [Gaiellaceae bacterium]